MNGKILLLALSAGIGAVGLGHLYLERLEAEVSGGEKVSVVVASDDLPVGTVLSEAQLALRSVVGGRKLDTLLADKQAIGEEVADLLTKRVEQFGVTVESVGGTGSFHRERQTEEEQ